MNVDRENFGSAALQEMREVAPSHPPHPMSDAVPLERVETFVVEERGQIALCGRVAGADRVEIGRRRNDDRRFIGDC